MRLLTGQNYRESWFATNTTQKVITISDLLTVPEFDPGATIDLLRYASREKVLNSKILELLIRKGWIRLVKKNEDFPGITVDATNVSKALADVERDTAVTVDDGGGGIGATALANLTDVAITDVTTGEVLKYSGGKWRNAADTGGNTLNDFPVMIMTAFDTTDPKSSGDSYSNVAAGFDCTLRSNAIPPGKSGKLIGMIVTGSTPFKAVLRRVIEGVPQEASATWLSDSGGWYFVPPTKNLITVAGSNSGLFNGFEVVVTNLEVSATTDSHAHFYYDEE